MTESLALYPQPRHARIGTATSGTQVHYVDDPGLPAEGYRITADVDGIVVRHAGDAGRRFAESTLQQLRSARGGVVPCCEVDDWPDLPVRGFLLDVSRGRVPTRDTLTRLVGLLALARYNHLQLYVEHSFAYQGHEVVWQDATPLTGADLAWLDDVCRAAGIELAANQATFGHFGRWLAHEPYRSRAECPDGWEPVAGYTAPPTVLAPEADNATFAVDLVREQLRHLTTTTVNIGCDETFELGRGRSRERVAVDGVGVVFAEHVNAIARPLLDEGRTVLAWADMVAKHPEALPALDPRITSLVWSYDAPGAAAPRLSPYQAKVADVLGFDVGTQASFAQLVQPYVETGRPVWVCPGTSSWNSFVGRAQNARENLLDAAQAARQHGAAGYLVCDWGDNGHLQPPVVSFAPLLLGGALAWCADTNAETDLAPVLDRWVFQDEAGVLGRCLEQLAGAAAATRIPAMNASPLFSRLLPQVLAFVEPRVDVTGVTAALAAIESVLAELAHARPACSDGALVVREAVLAGRLARLGALLLLGDAGVSSEGEELLSAQLPELLDELSSCWLARSRPSGLQEGLRLLQQAAALSVAAQDDRGERQRHAGARGARA